MPINFHMNKKTHIRNGTDFDMLLAEFKGLNHYDLLQLAGEAHQNQSNFDKSGFRPLLPITVSFYISKYF